MSPFSSFTHVDAKLSFYKKLGLDLAPKTFFCIQKWSIDAASSLLWGSCPPLEGSEYVAGSHRKASISSLISSDNTMDSGYSSGRKAKSPISPESQTIRKLEIDYEDWRHIFLYARQDEMTTCNRLSRTHFRLRGCLEPLQLLNPSHIRCVRQEWRDWARRRGTKWSRGWLAAIF